MMEESSDFIVTVQEPEYTIPCLICGELVAIPDPYHYPVVCDDCKRTMQIVKSLYKNKPCWNCKNFMCGCCTAIRK